MKLSGFSKSGASKMDAPITAVRIQTERVVSSCLDLGEIRAKLLVVVFITQVDL